MLEKRRKVKCHKSRQFIPDFAHNSINQTFCVFRSIICCCIVSWANCKWCPFIWHIATIDKWELLHKDLEKSSTKISKVIEKDKYRANLEFYASALLALAVACCCLKLLKVAWSCLMLSNVAVAQCYLMFHLRADVLEYILVNQRIPNFVKLQISVYMFITWNAVKNFEGRGSSYQCTVKMFEMHKCNCIFSQLYVGQFVYCFLILYKIDLLFGNMHHSIYARHVSDNEP